MHLAFGPTPTANKTAVFVGGCGTSGSVTTTHTWTVPSDAQFVHILCVGGGGGGGGGFSAAAGSAKGGGGGGGSGGITSALFHARMLPGTLFIGTNDKAAGGTAGNAGTAGTPTYVSPYALVSVQSSVTLVFAAGGGGGGAGASGAGGTAGAAGAVATVASNANLLTCCIANHMLIGRAGGAGGATATPSAGGGQNFFAPWCSGGTGGGSCNAANAQSVGGNFLFANALNMGWTNGTTTIIPGGAVTAPGNNGADHVGDFARGGILMPHSQSPYMPMFSCGGTGAGGTATAAGARGGDGGPGSGGGGGGAGTTGGTGGDGGPGYCIITWW